MIITIDGPAGTGKSTVAQAVAEQLGFDFLDTGAMYRAVALSALRKRVELHDHDAISQVAERARIYFDFSHKPPEIYLDAEPVGAFIRSEETTQASSIVAAVPEVREMLVAQQQHIAEQRENLVSEGRDQGTVVFPNADLKFYLEASAQERARRRADQLSREGVSVDVGQLQQEIEERDRRDMGRSVGPLAVASDAVLIDTTRLSQQDVIDRIVARVRSSR